MNEPALKLVAPNRDGEVDKDAPTYGEALVLLKRQRSRIQGLDLQIDNLKRELERAQGVEPESEDVRTVLGHWAKRVVEEGWWKKDPRIAPGHPRWSACSARLREPEYDVDYCLAAVEGALFQSRQGIKREWVDASSIFKAGNIERHFERAQDPYCQRVRLTRKLPEAVQVLLTDPGLPYLCEPCDCGHIRLEHSKGDPARDGAQACLVHSCTCEDFDDLHVRCEAWKAQR